MSYTGIRFSKMEEILQSKHIFLVLFTLIVDTNSRIERRDGTLPYNVQSGKISDVQEDIGLQWPMGIVTYYLDNLAYDHFIAHRVRMAMNTLEGSSCVRFKPILIKPAGNITWIHFTNPQGERNCVHTPTFKKDGEIVYVLGFDCLKQQEIMHSLLHAIGFKDEVTHPHRDQYIRVLWNNIQPEYRHLYRIQTSDGAHHKIVEYDPLSVMHFHDRAFSMNGHATIMPLVPGLVINPLSDLSQLDKMRLRLLFDHECNKRKVGDMIDTCKIIMSNHTKSKDNGNIESGTKSTTTQEVSADDGVHNETNGIEDESDIHKIDIGNPDRNTEVEIKPQDVEPDSTNDSKGSDG